MEMNSACMEIRVIKNVKMITPGDSFVKVRGRNLIARVLVQDFNVCAYFLSCRTLLARRMTIWPDLMFLNSCIACWWDKPWTPRPFTLKISSPEQNIEAQRVAKYFLIIYLLKDFATQPPARWGRLTWQKSPCYLWASLGPPPHWSRGLCCPPPWWRRPCEWWSGHSSSHLQDPRLDQDQWQPELHQVDQLSKYSLVSLAAASHLPCWWLRWSNSQWRMSLPAEDGGGCLRCGGGHHLDSDWILYCGVSWYERILILNQNS